MELLKYVAAIAACVVLCVSEAQAQTVSGSITAQDTSSTSALGAYSVPYYTGTPTANSTVSSTTPNVAVANVQISGTFTGTVDIEVSQDNGSTWRATGANFTGSVYTASQTSAPASFVVGIPGSTNIRIRAITAITGTVNVAMVFSSNPNAIYVLNPVGVVDNSSGNQLTITPGGAANTVTANPSAIYSGQQTVTLSAAALPSQALINGVVITAAATNTATIYVGSAGVTTSTGYKLLPGTSISYAVTNLSAIYILSGSNATDTVSFTGN